MGRHSSTPATQERRRLRQVAADLIRTVWQLLPDEFRRRMWHRRRQWRSRIDARYARRAARRVRDWATAREWDERLPKDAANWTDELNWGSVGVAATLRTTFRRRGDLLPDHSHDQEKS